MHRIADCRRRNENIPGEPGFQRWIQRTGIGNDEAEAIAVHGQAANCQILVGRGLWQGVAIGIRLDELSRGDQFLQMRIEIAAGVSVNTEFSYELLESSRAFRLPRDVLQDGGIGKHEAVSTSCQLSAYPNHINSKALCKL